MVNKIFFGKKCCQGQKKIFFSNFNLMMLNKKKNEHGDQLKDFDGR
jgi:hypothetical protein